MPEETNAERQYRHSIHRELMEWHKLSKVLRRERHKIHFHRYKYRGQLY